MTKHPNEKINVLELGGGWFTEKAGGLERVFSGLLEHLPAFAVDADGLVVGTEAVEQSSGGRARSFARADAPLPVRWFGARNAVRERLRHAPTDLVAAHFAFYAFPVLDLVRGYPLVVHFHGPWALESAAETASQPGVRLGVELKQRLEKIVYRRATRFIVLSRAFKTVLHEAYDVPEAHIEIVPGGVDTAAYATGLSAREARVVLGWPADRRVLLSVRRLVHRQGLENLIAATAELRRVYPDVLLFIAGTGPLKEGLEAQIAALELGEHVKLLGFVPDDKLALTYTAADLTVVPTVAHEGFGLITVESLAAGTPVLVTPVGGLPEVVAGLSPDLILPGSDRANLTQGLAAALSGVLRLPDRAACRQYARENYDYRTVAERTQAVYRRVLAEQRG